MIAKTTYRIYFSCNRPVAKNYNNNKDKSSVDDSIESTIKREVHSPMSTRANTNDRKRCTTRSHQTRNTRNSTNIEKSQKMLRLLTVRLHESFTALNRPGTAMRIMRRVRRSNIGDGEEEEEHC
jgi:hypothetical protein